MQDILLLLLLLWDEGAAAAGWKAEMMIDDALDCLFVENLKAQSCKTLNKQRTSLFVQMLPAVRFLFIVLSLHAAALTAPPPRFVVAADLLRLSQHTNKLLCI